MTLDEDVHLLLGVVEDVFEILGGLAAVEELRTDLIISQEEAYTGQQLELYASEGGLVVADVAEVLHQLNEDVNTLNLLNAYQIEPVVREDLEQAQKLKDFVGLRLDGLLGQIHAINLLVAYDAQLVNDLNSNWRRVPELVDHLHL